MKDIMMIQCRLKKIWLFLFSGANLFKTIYFNFRIMPFKEAIRLPIWLYGKVKIPVCSGRVRWISTTLPHTGGWTIGNDCMRVSDNLHPDVTIIELSGKLILGEHGRICNGVILRIHGLAQMEDNVDIGYRSKIICHNKIYIGAYTRVSWECQIIDTNFHYYIKDDKFVNRKEGSIFIGSHCWIGNRVTVNKDSYIADYCIVASNSLVNKSADNEQKCVWAGIPARKVANNCQRIFESEQWELRKLLDDFFANNASSKCYEIS